MKSLALTPILLVLFLMDIAQAQFNDDFLDGNFTTNPTWVGDSTKFEIDAGQRLHLAAPSASGDAMLTTSSQAIEEASWEFYIKFDFNPSSSNFADIYLVADRQDLRGPVDGYFVRVGNTQDEISLYKQTGNSGQIAKIIDGTDGRVDLSAPEAKIKVVRDALGNWQLFSDVGQTGTYTLEGSAFDDHVVASSWFGIFCHYTSTRADKFYFDDFTVTGIANPDHVKPETDSLAVVTENTLKVFFSEQVKQNMAEDPANYQLSYLSENPSQATLLGDTAVELSFSQPFPPGDSLFLKVANIQDLAGNALDPVSLGFIYKIPRQPAFNQLLVTEIMADPSPPVKLPESEYLELYNPGDDDLLLVDASVSIGEDSFRIDRMSIHAGEYAILCPVSTEDKFTAYGNTLGISNWPGLRNDGDTLAIRNKYGELVFSMAYRDDWIRDADKAKGGWSLEMIDVNYPCSSDNWSVSTDENGGTPGKENSVKSDRPDLKGPTIVQAFAPSDSTVAITLDEKFDPSTLFLENMAISPALSIHEASADLPLLNALHLSLDDKILPKIQYVVTINNLADCAGNLMAKPGNSTSFVLPEIGDSLDIILNEILFDPRPGGVDFVEIYNRSDKYINLRNWQIAFQKDDGSLENSGISGRNVVMGPGNYLALTSDPEVLKADYPQGLEENFLKVEKMPNLLNDHGTILLLNADAQIMDSFDYSVSFHSKLLVDTEGVSLERINADGPTNNANNWHSAAGTVGYATPGKKNSQALGLATTNETISIEPKAFAPGSAGLQDFTTINLHFNNPGNMASINILDALGRKVKTIANNESLALEDSFLWDGDDDTGHQVRVGYYIVWVQISNPNGTTKVYKRKVAVGARF